MLLTLQKKISHRPIRAEPDLQVKRNAALDKYMSRRAQESSYGGVELVGVLGDLACVQDEKMASAVEVLLGDDLQVSGLGFRV